MDWIEIILKTPSDKLEQASAIANMAVPSGIYIEDYSALEDEVFETAHVDLIDEELLSMDREKSKIHLYLDPGDSVNEALEFLKQRLFDSDIPFEISSESVKDEDWLNNWRKYFKPLKIGERLLIQPSWIEPEETDRAILYIDPGLAFGTGKHETTRLCLELIEKYLKEGDKTLDIGCGSGILGISAALLGAKEALGVDIDPAAVKTAGENARLNKISDKFTAVCGDLAEKVEGKYNIIVANIVADAIILLSKSVRKLMADDAVYIVSGIIDTRADEVRASLEADGFEVDQVSTDGGWYAFALK